MAVQRLSVAGYRSLLDVSLEFGEITVILGANGSGKTNVYRALRLAHACGEGQVARAVVQEGGMSSITYAGHRRGEPKVELALDLEDMSYEVDLGTAARGGPTDSLAFPLDPLILREQILLPGTGRRVDLLDRVGTTAFVRDDDGNRVTFPAAFHLSESVLSQLVDARQFPEMAYVRQTLRQMRFHHQLRTDDEAPARQPTLGSRTLAVADDGSDLAAALRTIEMDGDQGALADCIDRAFPGASLHVAEDESHRLEVGLRVPSLRRPLSARELSDGQLRFLFLAAALLSLRPPGLLVLNEPESSLHPDLMPALAQLVGSAAKRSQIVVTTHSAGLAGELLDSHMARGVCLEMSSGTTSLRLL